MQVAQWGNSLAVRLPATVVKALDLKPGDDIEIAVAGARTFEIARGDGEEELFARVRQLRGAMPIGFSFDRYDANER